MKALIAFMIVTASITSQASLGNGGDLECPIKRAKRMALAAASARMDCKTNFACVMKQNGSSYKVATTSDRVNRQK